jgi:iron-sulfur cluster repair protein YtfE (RIC family)
MLRFTDLIRRAEVVRDVKQKYPETAEVFERFGLREACYDCSIEQAARKVGASSEDLLAELNRTIAKQRSFNAG